jgi:PAS domain S-box-containing protein
MLVDETVGGGGDDFPVVITTTPANARHYKIASGGFIVLVVVLAIMLPIATVQLPAVDAFIPVIQTVMCAADLLTAALLFAQYRVQPQRALLALAGGFISTGLFAFVQTLAFPGAYGPGAVIGDNLSSASWLFIFWHTVFPLAVIVYALWKDESYAVQWPRRSRRTDIGITIACAVTATAGLAWVATAGAGYLPSLYETLTQRGYATVFEGVGLSLLTAIAVGVLFFRRRTIIDQWLIVTLFAWLPTFLVAATFAVTRFSLGWYMARAYALLAGSSLLFVLLTETLNLYARLANAVVLLRRERADRLAIFNTVVDGIITCDRNGTIETLNPAAARLFGYAPEEVIGRNIKLLMPEPDRAEPDSYLAKYLEADQARIVGSPGRELTGKRKDGSVFSIELATGEVDVAGKRMFTGVVRDITQRKRSRERQALLVAELDHRVKNILAQVVGVITSTHEGGRSLDGFVLSLAGRIQSMAAAHTLLSRAGWQGVGLDGLVRTELAPYATGTNVRISGTDVMLTAAETQALAKVLHELATNAAKYGALSIPGGQVSVTWDFKPNGPAASLILEWREAGGPPVASNIRSSYGIDLIRDLIPHELGGTVDLVFAAEGVNCRIGIRIEQA